MSGYYIQWKACNFFKSFVNTHSYLIACCICIHTDISSHTRVGNLHVIICILYKASMPDRPPTAQLVCGIWLIHSLHDVLLIGPVSSLETDRQARSPSDRDRGGWGGGERDREMDIFRSSGQIKQYNHNWLSSWWYELFKAVRPVLHAALRSVFAYLCSYSLLICLHLRLCSATPLSPRHVFVFLHRNRCKFVCVRGNELWCLCVRARVLEGS